MKKKITFMILMVILLATIIIGIHILGKDDSYKLSMTPKESSEISLGDSYKLTKYAATKNKDNATAQVKISVKLENGNKLKGAMKPVVKNGKVYFTYVGDYIVRYYLEDDKGEVQEEQTENVTVKADKKLETDGLAICMYHYVYDPANKPADINNNYISTTALSEELDYLEREKYYYPSWDEVRAYVDGNLILPNKSIVLSFDDGAENFLKLGIPIFAKHKIPVTSFLITSSNGAKKVKKYSNDFVNFESHSHNMHRPGGNIGHGGVFTALSEEDAVSDLKKSIQICGNGNAFAYPFGDYTDNCKEYVKKAGFKCAVTTNYGKVYPGDDPLLLKRVRMFEGQSLDSFKGAI